MEFAKILKANPYHDEKGRFSTHDKANFVSVGGVFDRQRERAASRGKAKADFKDRLGDEEFANEHKKKLDALTESERAALFAYTQNAYKGINKYLRTGSEISDPLKTTIAEMDSAMSKASLGRDTIAYRGITGGTASKLRALHDEGKLIGATIEDKGFSSMTVSKFVAKNWSGTINLEVKVPKTAKGLFVGTEKGQPGQYTMYDSEKEIIMDRGSKVKITGSRKESHILILEAEWV